MRKKVYTISLTLFALLNAPLWAQDTPKDPPPPKEQKINAISPMFWSVNTVIEGYIQQMTRYYNLTPEQQEYTRDLMSQRVKRFLGDYEKDVRWMAAELYDYQTRRELPPREIAMEWGLRAKPLISAIRREIFDGNMKWRDSLNEEQRRQHDRDLILMKKEFETLEKRVDRWSQGEISPGDFPGAIGNQPRIVRKSEDAWEYYVRNFCHMYNLDEGQKQTALTVLRQLREEATRYREAHKDEFAKMDAEEAEASKAAPKIDPEELKRSQEQIRERTQKRRDLEKPIAELFNRLKTQLYEIPTAEQRRVRDLQLDKLDSMARGRYRPRPSTNPAAASKPTTPS